MIYYHLLMILNYLFFEQYYFDLIYLILFLLVL